MPPQPSAEPPPDVLGLAAGLPPLAAAGAHPCYEPSLAGALAAAGRGLIRPILFGRKGKFTVWPTDTSVGSPREVRVTRAITTAPIVSLTAFLVSTTTGRGLTGGGSSAHHT